MPVIGHSGCGLEVPKDFKWVPTASATNGHGDNSLRQELEQGCNRGAVTADRRE